MNELLVNIIGYSATVIGTSLMLPQAFKSYKTRSVSDLSWGMLILYFLNCVLWLIYGVLIGALHLIITNSIALVISVIQIVLKIKYS
jgi:MtN3 and saliva related transmembrane protein